MTSEIEAKRVAVPGVDAHVCYDVTGAGPPLVMLHSARGLRINFRWNGLVDALSDNYRVILIDALAHGDSDGPLEPTAYTMQLRVAQVLAVLDDLRIERAHVLGYSMGGHTALGIVRYAPERLRSIVVGGMGPKGPQLDDQYTQEQLLAAAKGGMPIAALAAALKDIEDLGDSLATAPVPSLFFCGSQDPLLDDARRGAQLAGARLIELQDLGHRDVYKHGIEKLVPDLREFLARC